MKRLALTMIILLAPTLALTQNDSVAAVEKRIKREIIEELRAERDAEKKRRPKLFEPYGFVRNYICYDTRQCITTMGEMFNIMPKDVLPNEDGSEDLNAVHEMTFVSFTTRLGVDVTAPRYGKRPRRPKSRPTSADSARITPCSAYVRPTCDWRGTACR